jgi:membrane protein
LRHATHAPCREQDFVLRRGRRGGPVRAPLRRPLDHRRVARGPGSRPEAGRARAAARGGGPESPGGHGIGGAGKQHVGKEAAHEPGRGREASTPTEIPAQGWKDILWRVWEEIGQDRVMAVAAGVTFYGLLAIFPAIAAFVSL